MTLPQQNTALARPTSFYYLMCQLDRVQYQNSLAFFAFHFQRPPSPLLQFSLYWRLARTSDNVLPTTDLVAKYGRRTMRTALIPVLA